MNTLMTKESIMSFIRTRTAHSGVMKVSLKLPKPSGTIEMVTKIHVNTFMEGGTCGTYAMELFMYGLGVKFDTSKTKYSSLSEIDESIDSVFDIIQKEKLDIFIREIKPDDEEPGTKDSYTPEEWMAAEKINGLPSIK